MSKENPEGEEETNVKVHEIKFDEYGIMDDGLDESTNDQLKAMGATATAIDEDLFEDEDLDELEDDLNNLEVWILIAEQIKTFIHPAIKSFIPIFKMDGRSLLHQNFL